MSIAEKLVKIAEQMQPTYEDAKNSYEKGYKDGENNKSFWNKYQDNGNRRNFDYAFAGEGWTDELYNPKYPIVAESYIGMFRDNDKITSTKVSLDFSNNTNEDKTDTCFINCSSLVEIPTLIVGRKTIFLSSFDYCSSLEYIGFLGELWCNIILLETEVLSDETVMQIVHIAKDFANDEDESVQELAYMFSVYFSSPMYGKLWELTGDERFPEQYQGLILGEILDAKGWGC